MKKLLCYIVMAISFALTFSVNAGMPLSDGAYQYNCYESRLFTEPIQTVKENTSEEAVVIEAFEYTNKETTFSNLPKNSGKNSGNDLVSHYFVKLDYEIGWRN